MASQWGPVASLRPDCHACSAQNGTAPTRGLAPELSEKRIRDYARPDLMLYVLVPRRGRLCRIIVGYASLSAPGFGAGGGASTESLSVGFCLSDCKAPRLKALYCEPQRNRCARPGGGLMQSDLEAGAFVALCGRHRLQGSRVDRRRTVMVRGALIMHGAADGG